MNVFCIFRTLQVCAIEENMKWKKGNQNRIIEEVDILEAIFIESENADAYIKAHSPEIREQLHKQAWILQ